MQKKNHSKVNPAMKMNVEESLESVQESEEISSEMRSSALDEPSSYRDDTSDLISRRKEKRSQRYKSNR